MTAPSEIAAAIRARRAALENYDAQLTATAEVTGMRYVADQDKWLSIYDYGAASRDAEVAALREERDEAQRMWVEHSTASGREAIAHGARVLELEAERNTLRTELAALKAQPTLRALNVEAVYEDLRGHYVGCHMARDLAQMIVHKYGGTRTLTVESATELLVEKGWGRELIIGSVTRDGRLDQETRAALVSPAPEGK